MSSNKGHTGQRQKPLATAPEEVNGCVDNSHYYFKVQELLPQIMTNFLFPNQIKSIVLKNDV